MTCAALLAGAEALGNSNGSQTGRSMRGCTATSGCHGMNAGATAMLEGPATLTPGQRATYTLIVTSTRADFRAGGFNIAVAGAALMATAGQGSTRMVNGEMSHMMPIARSGADVRVRFDVVAPAAAGAVMITAAGNAVNGDSNAANDAWAITALPVTVGGAGTDGGTTPQDAGVRDAGPAVEQYDPTASLAYGKCSAGRAPAGRVSAGVWVTLALVGASLARRRR